MTLKIKTCFTKILMGAFFERTDSDLFKVMTDVSRIFRFRHMCENVDTVITLCANLKFQNHFLIFLDNF